MGENKALKLFLGRPLIQRVIERLTPIADEMIVTTNRPAEYGFLNVPLVSDIQPGHGALGGLYTAVASASQPFIAVVACDMPFASANFFESACRLMVEEDADVIIVKTEQGYEPLHALYRRENCLPAIDAAIQSDQWKVTSWFSQVKVHEMKDFDTADLCFWNLNTPEEFAKAEEIALSSP